jgi:hypothetical protein
MQGFYLSQREKRLIERGREAQKTKELEPIQTTANESGLLSLFLALISQCSIYSGRKILHTAQHLSAVNISRRFFSSFYRHFFLVSRQQQSSEPR